MKKICIRCCKQKRISHFHRSPDNRDGYKNICRPCVSITQAQLKKAVDWEDREGFINSAIKLPIEQKQSAAKELGL